MAQRRLLSRALGCSEKFTAVPDIAGKGLAEFAQLLYCLMIPHADDYGRLSDGAKGIKLSILPDSVRSVEDFDQALDCLARAGLLVRYVSRGDRAIQIENFSREQPGLRLDRSKKSSWDAPPGNANRTAITGNFPAVPGHPPLIEPNRTEGKVSTYVPLSPPNSPIQTDDRPERLWTFFRQLMADQRGATLALTPTSPQAGHAIALCAQYPDDDWLYRIVALIVQSENREVNKAPITLGWIRHWAPKAEEQLREQDTASPGHWYDDCHHDPQCEARHLHEQKVWDEQHGKEPAA
jgi:hypothetical protein